MSALNFYQIFFIVFTVTTALVRTPFSLAHKRAKRNQQIKLTRRPLTENLLAFLVGIGIIVLPFFNIFTDYLDRFNFIPPDWVRIVAVIGFVFSFIFYTWSHLDLGGQWSPVLETKSNHRLITTGIYRHIRHPMYLGFFFWAVLVGLLLPNWLTLIASWLSFALLYFIRIPAEEEMMIDQFGEKYIEYMKATGRIFPKI